MLWTLAKLLTGSYLRSLTQWAVSKVPWRQAYNLMKDRFGALGADLRREVWQRAKASAAAGSSWNWLNSSERPDRSRIPVSYDLDHAYEVKVQVKFYNPSTGKEMSVPVWKGLDRLAKIGDITQAILDDINDVYFHGDYTPDFLKGFELQDVTYEAVWRKYY